MHRPSVLLTTVVLATALTEVAATQDPHTRMNQRGAAVMGFDQETTTHHFYLYENGGAIDVGANATSDVKNRDAIRSHLPHIAMMFSEGNFDAPMLVHGDGKVPGTTVMADRKASIRYRYVDTAGGGRVDIVTTDAAALSAVHAFLKYQIAEHKTGDSVTIRKR